MNKGLVFSLKSSDLLLDTGALYVTYEKQIIDAFRWVESTQTSYRNTIDNAAPFLRGIPFCECTTDDFDNALENINNKRICSGKEPYFEPSLKKYRSVFSDLCGFAEVYSHGAYSSVVWGSAWKDKNSTDNSKSTDKKRSQRKVGKKEQEKIEKEARAKRMVDLPRSLTMPEEIKLLDEIEKGIEDNSYYAGLALMFYLGLRPGECCGVNFGDIRPLEGYPETYCLYIYEQITTKETSSNKLKTSNAYRMLPVPSELYDLLSRRRTAVEQKLHGDCSHCYIVCLDETVEGLKKNCNRRQFRVFSQTLLRKINMEEQVVSNLSVEVRDGLVYEQSVTSYLLRRNFSTALAAVCGMEDDELKYLMGHDIGAADEQRHDFVNPDTLFQLWEKLNLRSYKTSDELVCRIDSDQASVFLQQKQTTLIVEHAALGKDGVYLRVFNEFPNDYIRVKLVSGDNASIKYRTALEPVELKRIGRVKIHGEFAHAVKNGRSKVRKP